MPRSKHAKLRIWAHQYRVMADRLAFHIGTGNFDDDSRVAVRQAQDALIKAAETIELHERLPGGS